MSKSLCSTPETNRVLLANYISILKRKEFTENKEMGKRPEKVLHRRVCPTG